MKSNRVLRTLLIILFCFSSFEVLPSDCPNKLNWKKFKTEIEVKEAILGCLPLHSSRSKFIQFLNAQKKIVFSDVNNKIVFISAKAKQSSFWIEKQWLMEFEFDENDKLIDLRVKVGLTGP